MARGKALTRHIGRKRPRRGDLVAPPPAKACRRAGKNCPAPEEKKATLGLCGGRTLHTPDSFQELFARRAAREPRRGTPFAAASRPVPRPAAPPAHTRPAQTARRRPEIACARRPAVRPGNGPTLARTAPTGETLARAGKARRAPKFGPVRRPNPAPGKPRLPRCRPAPGTPAPPPRPAHIAAPEHPGLAPDAAPVPGTPGCTPQGDRKVCKDSLATAAHSRVNFRQITDPGYQALYNIWCVG